MNTPSTKQQLLEKFLSDQCTREELEILMVHLQRDPESEYAEVMQQVWDKLRTYSPVHKADSDRMFNAILLKTQLQEAAPVPKLAKTRTLSQAGWYRVAAVFTGLLLLAGGLYRLLPEHEAITHQTAYGQMVAITLPDRSVIRLNGNSSLRYGPNWEKAGPREIWLEGEAFFSVVHTSSHQPFIVHTSKQAQVEVLGTEFTVSDRQQETRVVLNKGSIRLTLDQPQQQARILMQPGDLVKWHTPARIIRKRVNPEVYSSWTEKKLVFDNTPLGEVVAMLQNTYGLEVAVADSSLLQKQLSGSTPIRNVDVFLTGLARTFNLQISKTEHQVKIRSSDTD